MNRCFDPYPFIDVVNKFYGAVCQGLDNNLLGNCVINLCIYSDPVQQYPMKQVLHKPETSGRLIKWAIEPSEFNIRYKQRTAVKGQILVDFIMEFTPKELAESTQLTPDLPIWKLSVDGAANA